MRINDTNRAGYAQLHYSKQASTAGAANRTSGAKDSVDTSDRTSKVEKLKQMMQSGQPIDVGKLADAMVKSGVLFDEKA